MAAMLTLPMTARAMEKASIVLQWLPQAQFAGFYMAMEQGFYKNKNVDLTIIQGGPDTLASELLEGGEVDFATMFLSTAIKKRQTIPLVNIGQFVQKSALMLITKKSAKINTIQNLDGKKVGLWANEFQIQPRVLFQRENIRTTVVPQSSSLDLFLRGGVAAATGMWYNEYHTLLSYGIDHEELNVFFFSDLDLNFPEDGIYAMEQTANERPELCRALVEATIQGWVYAFEHPEEAIDSVMRRMIKMKIPANRAHQRWMLNRMRDIIQPKGSQIPIGVLTREDFERVQEALFESWFIEEGALYPEFYRGPVR